VWRHQTVLGGGQRIVGFGRLGGQDVQCRAADQSGVQGGGEVGLDDQLVGKLKELFSDFPGESEVLIQLGQKQILRLPDDIRVDTGAYEGGEVSQFYDPMIAKLIAHGATRQEAITRTIRAIDDYQISGIQTTLDFCRFALSHDAFQSGQFDTKFVDRYFRPEFLEPQFTEEEKILLAALAVEFFEVEDKQVNPTTPLSPANTTHWTNRLT